SEADKERKAAIEGANRLDGILNETEKHLKNLADQLDKAEVTKLEGEISTCRELVAKAQSGESEITSAELKEKTDAFQNATLSLFDKVHKSRSESSSSSDSGASSEGQSTEGGDKKQ